MKTIEIKKKLFSADMTIPEGEGKYFVAKITSDAVDRDGEVLLPDGMDATDFEKNPVVFMVHNYQELPVGQVEALKRQKNYWLAKIKIADRPEDHEGEWLPYTVFSLIKQRVIRGVSVGFQSTASPRIPTKADREKFGEDVHAVIPRWKLLELSIAPLPANQDALIEAVSKAVKSGEMGKSFAEKILPPEVAEKVSLGVPVVVERKKYTLEVPRVRDRSKARRKSAEDRMALQIKKELGRAKGMIYV